MVAEGLVPPQGSPPKPPRNPISRKQVENVVSRSVAVFGIVFGAQTIPWLLGQLDEAYPLWLWIVVPAMFGSLVFALVMSIVKRAVRFSHGVVAVIYLLVLITWPLTIRPDVEIFPGIHWTYYLLTVATACAAIAFTTVGATIYLFFAPLVFMVVRISPLGGDATWPLAALETVYSIILGGAVMIIVTMLRQAASSVDAAQATALERYGHAVRQHATEVERVQVDSIVHDSVLTTLLSAARAHTPEAKRLASTMATNAIGHLREAALASPDDGTMVRLTLLAERIADASAALASPFELHIRRIGSGSLPAHAADGIYSATVQAMVNSLQHAGDDIERRWISVRALPPSGVEVVVGDTGTGFELADVPSERLGVRVSILERIAGVGGRADIRSAIGEGTVVTIRWQHQQQSRDEVQE